MYDIKESIRFKQIEDEYNADIEDLLYQMHWPEDMMHQEIGEQLCVPRPTITRWFKLFDLPTQSCRRFTDENLTSWLYKIGKLKKKLRYEGPDRRIQRTKGNVNIDFFKKWSENMAYILGFFAADGGMFINSGGSRYLQFTSTDYEILDKIRNLLLAKQKISLKKKGSKNHKNCYLLQVGSKEMFNDLIQLGFTPNKSLTIKFPKVPNKYLCHFVRGYFDGDGSIIFGTYKRKSRNNKDTFYIRTSFTSGNKKFLNKLSKRFYLNTDIGKGHLRHKSHKRGYDLCYSINDSRKLFKYMYNKNTNLKVNCYLERKYNKFVKAFKTKGT